MIDQSGINLLDLIPTDLKRVASTGGGEYHGPCPFCGGDDRFVVQPVTGRWFCRQGLGACDGGGDAIAFVQRYKNLSFAEALADLNLTDTDAPKAPTKYDSLADYAKAHGVAESVYLAAGWSNTTRQGRPALLIKTATGDRWRFLDGEKPKYKSEDGYKACWYGLDRAAVLAKQLNAPLILCNGEASVVAASAHGLPACAITGGERALNDDQLAELNRKWSGAVYLALDCDDTGRRAAEKIHAQLPKSVVLDLGLGDGQDLADFCKLHSTDTLTALHALAPQHARAATPTNSRDVAAYMVERLNRSTYSDGKPFIIPFPRLHALGGLAHITPPGKLIGVMAMSGHGKTSLLETWIDAALVRGESGVWYGPEWKVEEYHNRRIQRYNGPSLDQINQYDLYKWYIDNDQPVPDGVRAMPAEQIDKYQKISKAVATWPGMAEYVDGYGGIESQIEQMRAKVETMRADGLTVNWAVFDYIQLVHAEQRNSADSGNQYEYALGLVKEFCGQYELVGIVGSQVNKAETAKMGDNNILRPSSAHYIREDKFNLLISLNTVYEEDIHNPLPNGDPGLLMTQYGYAAVIKNSLGQRGDIKIMSDFKRLSWQDKPWHNVTYTLSEKVNDKDLPPSMKRPDLSDL